MSIAPPPPAKKPAAPPPPKASANPAATPAVTRNFKVQSGTLNSPMKTILYGTGGIGKTELCSLLKDVGVKPLILDLEQGSKFLDVDRIDDIATWDELRSVLVDDSIWQGYGAVVIDSFTKAEELATSWTIANVKHEKGHFVDSIEGYGFGKGFTHVYETFLQLLGDLDMRCRRGQHVAGVAHDCVSNVPNPAGEDWIRYEPRLQSPNSGKASIRLRVKEWTDHLLFVGYDTFVTKDGKGTGSGTRMIYPSELPTHMAKSRCLSEPLVYERGNPQLWKQLLNKE